MHRQTEIEELNTTVNELIRKLDSVDALVQVLGRVADAMEASTKVTSRLVQISEMREDRLTNRGTVLIEVTPEQLEFLRSHYAKESSQG